MPGSAVFRATNAAHLAVCLGVGNGAAQLGGQGGQECLIRIIKASGLVLSHQQHALYKAFMRNGNSKKGLVTTGSSILEKLRIQFFWYAGKVDRPVAVRNTSDQPLTEFSLYLPDQLVRQAVSCSKYVATVSVIGKVYGAYIRAHDFTGSTYNHAERRIQVRRSIYLTDYPGQ